MLEAKSSSFFIVHQSKENGENVNYIREEGQVQNHYFQPFAPLFLYVFQRKNKCFNLKLRKLFSHANFFAISRLKNLLN